MDKQVLLAMEVISGLLTIRVLVDLIHFIAWIVREYDKRHNK